MIVLDDIEFSYLKNGVPAITDVNATIGEGIYLLAGENGAGKTTLFHIIAGLATPTRGKCYVNGYDSCATRPSEKGKVFLLEENMHFPGDTIRMFAKLHSPFYPSFSPDIFEENLMKFGMTGNEPLKRLSYGNLKKAQLAYVLALGVDILLLDEPSNGLDIQSKESLCRMIATSLKDNQSIIVATHTVSDFSNLFEGCIILKRSRLLYAGNEEQISSSLAFISSHLPREDALYTEYRMGHASCIIPVEVCGSDTAIDWKLLYSALHSTESDKLLNYINSHS